MDVVAFVGLVCLPFCVLATPLFESEASWFWRKARTLEVCTWVVVVLIGGTFLWQAPHHVTLEEQLAFLFLGLWWVIVGAAFVVENVGAAIERRAAN